VWLDVENSYTSVRRATDAERLWLHRFLTHDRGGDLGEERLYDPRASRFPTGLLAMVERGARDTRIEVEVYDRRERPAVFDAGADLGWLRTRLARIGGEERPYQYDAVRAAAEAGRGIIRAATGSGKGEISCGLAKAIPTRWLYLVHRSNLIDDIAQRWTRRGDGTPPLLVRGGPRMPYGERLTLATFAGMAKTLESYPARTREYLAGFGGIIVDECHVLPAATHAAVAGACTGAYYRIGLSGTPLDRADGRSLAALAMLGPVVYSISYRVLVASGLVAEPSVVMVEHRQRPVDTDSWAAMYDALVVDAEERNRLVVQMTLAATRPAMVFTERVAHARKLARMLREEGLRVEVVTGATADRSAVARRLAAREIDVIVTNRVFQEGLDVPEIRAVVLAQGMKAKIMLLQRIGRGMRLEQRDGQIVDSSRAFEVWDVYDAGNSLAGHSKARLDAYRGQGFRVDVRAKI